jgi:hypothetical protein
MFAELLNLAFPFPDQKSYRWNETYSQKYFYVVAQEGWYGLRM